jgi:hypothetical protein
MACCPPNWWWMPAGARVSDVGQPVARLARAPQGQAATVYRFPANLRRHYERLRRPPQGFIVIGDALASFNPAYGQGMTVAALQAQVLQRCLCDPARAEQLAPQYFARAARAIDVPWQIATGEDLRYPEATGPRPLLLRPLNAHFTRVHQAAAFDAEVCRAFFGVAGLQNSPASMFTPAMLWRTLRGARRFQAADGAAPGARPRGDGVEG